MTTKNALLEELHVGTVGDVRRRRLRRGEPSDGPPGRDAHRLLGGAVVRGEHDAERLYRRSERTLLASWRPMRAGPPAPSSGDCPASSQRSFRTSPSAASTTSGSGRGSPPRRAGCGGRRDGSGLRGGGGGHLRRLDPRGRRGDARRSRAARLHRQRDHPSHGHVARRATRCAPETEAEPWTWADYLRTFDLSPELLATADRAAFRLLVARVDGEPATAALTLDSTVTAGSSTSAPSSGCAAAASPPRSRHGSCTTPARAGA